MRRLVTCCLLIVIIFSLAGCNQHGPVFPQVLEIISIDAPSTVSVGQPFTLATTVRFAFNTATDVVLQVYEHAGPLLAEHGQTLIGSGTQRFSFSLNAPSSSRQWQLNIHLFRVADGQLIQTDLKSVVINVIGTSEGKVKVHVYAIDDANRTRGYLIETVEKIPGAQIRVDYPGGSQVLTTTSTYPGPYVEVPENSTVTVSLVSPPPGWQFAGYWDIYFVSWTQGPSRTFNVGTNDKHVAASFTRTQPPTTRFYYLYPPTMHLLVGERSSEPIKVLDDNGREIQGAQISFTATSDLFTVSPDGYVTPLRREREFDYLSSLIIATVNGVSAVNPVVVRVLSQRYDLAFGWAMTEHTALYYPTRIQGENIEYYVQKYQIPTVCDYAYRIQAELMGTTPGNGARQIFAVECGEGDYRYTPCGLALRPALLRFGWNILGDAWANCFLVPTIPPRSPQWSIFFHELGHNFTLENDVFATSFEGVAEYVEGLATSLWLSTAESLLRGRYPINDDVRNSLALIYNRDVQRFLDKYHQWLQSHIPFPNLSQLERNDIVDGIWLYWRQQKGPDYDRRFFSLFSPRNASVVGPVVWKRRTIEHSHTLFAAMVSAAVGQDLSQIFQYEYGFPLDMRLFNEAFQAFLSVL